MWAWVETIMLDHYCQKSESGLKIFFFLHLPKVRFLSVCVCVCLLITTPLISKVYNHALFAPLPRSCDQKKTLMKRCVCVSMHIKVVFYLCPSLTLARSVAPAPPWTLGFKEENPGGADNLSSAVRGMGQRSWAAVAQLTWQIDSGCSGTGWYTV